MDSTQIPDDEFQDALEGPDPTDSTYEIVHDALLYVVDTQHPQFSEILAVLSEAVATKIWRSDGEDLVGLVVFNCADGEVREVEPLTAIDIEKVQSAKNWAQLHYGSGESEISSVIFKVNEIFPEGKYCRRVLFFSETSETLAMIDSRYKYSETSDVRKWVFDRLTPFKAASQATLRLTEAVGAKVSLYTCVAPPTKPRASVLTGDTLEEVRTALEMRSEETGLKVSGTVENYLEIFEQKIFFSQNDIQNVYNYDKHTITYLGNVARTKIHINNAVGSAYFVRPDSAGRVLTAALIHALVRHNTYAIVSYRCKLYALQPEREVGLFMVPLAFVEEVRHVKIPERDQIDAEDFRTHVDLAKNIVRDFHVTNFKYMPNPAVEHVRGTLEEMIKVGSREIFDQCQPPLSRRLKAQDHCREWQQRLALLESNAPSAYKADYKRARTDTPVDVPTVDEMKIHVRHGTVSKMTAVTLKAFLKTRLNVGDSGNKAELVDRVLRNMQNLR